MKLWVFNILGCRRGMSLGGDMEIASFVDVSKDDNELRWGMM